MTIPHWLVHRRGIVLVGALIVAVLAGWRVSGLRADADMLALLGDDDPSLAAYREAARDMPLIDSLLAVLPDEAPESVAAATAELAALESTSLVVPVPRNGRGGAILAIVPAFPASDIRASGRLLADVRSVLARHSLPGRLTGTPAFLVESQQVLQRDLIRAGLITVVAVAAFFAAAYGIGWLAVLALLPIGLGIACGMGALSFVTDRVTLLAATVPTLVVGLGIDHCIHMVQATNGFLADGHDKTSAIAAAWLRLWRPLTVGAVTTAAAFASLSVARLEGLSDMGQAGCLTTLGVFACSMVLLPVVLSWCPARWLGRRSALAEPLTRLGGLVGARRTHVLAGAGVLTAVALAGAFRLTVLEDNTRLEAPDLQARILQEQLFRSAGVSTTPLLVRFASMGEATRFARLDDAEGAISRVDPLPSNGGAMAVVHARGNPFSPNGYASVMAAIRTRAREAGVTAGTAAGAPVVNARLSELLHADGPRVGLAALAMVAVVLALGMGGLRSGLVALLPLACALVWAGGAIGLAGGTVSVMSVAVAPLVLGIGVDDGVHLIHAWRRCDGDAARVLGGTGVAVTATTVATVAAFGSLMLSRTPALVQFGLQASLGLTAALAATLLLMPAVCALTEGKPLRKGGPLPVTSTRE